MSATSPVLLSSTPSSPSLPSICGPVAALAGPSSSRRSQRRRSGQYRRARSYLDRIRSTSRSSLLGRALARLSRARARRRVSHVDGGDQVVPNLDGLGLLVNQHPNPIILDIPIPEPRRGFSVLAVLPPPNVPPQHPAPPPPVFPVEDPLQNQVNLLPMLAVTIKSTTLDDAGVLYYIRANETFQRVYYDYAAKVDRFVHEILIVKNGSFIDMADTPLGVGVANGDILYVISQNPEYNLNTRVKHFYIRDHRTRPLRLKVCGELDANLSGLYEMWGEAAGVDPGRLIVSYENQILTSFHTVSDACIKNEQEVFVLALNNNYSIA